MSQTTVNVTDQTWREYRQQLYRFILKRVSDPVVAEDIVQDVMVKMFTQRDSLRDGAKLRPWLYQVTRNAITDFYRARHNATMELPDDLLVAGDESQENVSQELAECCIRPFIAELFAPYQEAILLSEIEGLTASLNLASRASSPRMSRSKSVRAVSPLIAVFFGPQGPAGEQRAGQLPHGHGEELDGGVFFENGRRKHRKSHHAKGHSPVEKLAHVEQCRQHVIDAHVG